MRKKAFVMVLTLFPALMGFVALLLVPETIITHFGGAGADAWGPSWALPVMGVVIAAVNAGVVALARYSRRDASKQVYLVVSDPMPEWARIGIPLLLDVVFAIYVIICSMPFDSEDLIFSGRLFSWGIVGIALAFMIGLGGYFVSGRGAKHTQVGKSHPGKEPTKDDIRLSRTVGFFVLLCAGFLVLMTVVLPSLTSA